MKAIIHSISPLPKRRCTEFVVEVEDCISKVNELKAQGFNVYEVRTEEGSRFFLNSTQSDFERDFRFFVLNRDRLTSKTITGEDALRIWNECSGKTQK